MPSPLRELWLPAMFTEPRRRSWPHEPTRLEILATRMGIDDETFRQLLRDEVQRRLRERGEAWDKLDRTLEMRGKRLDT